MDLVIAHDAVVAMDHSQILLFGSHDALAQPDLSLALLEQAQDGPRIASTGPALLVLSPHQNNFEMSLRIEVLRQEPLDDLDAWDEVFEAPIDVDDDGELYYESPTMQGDSWSVPPGRYLARIAGRGFLNRGWPGSSTPGDSWRVQLWPRSADVSPRRLREWTPPPEPEPE